MSTAGRRDNTTQSTLDCINQEIERMSFKIDDQSLTNGKYRSGYERQSCQSPPHQPPPYRPPSHHPPPRYSLQHLQFTEFFYEELQHPNYQYNNDYEDERIGNERRRRFANPNANKRGGFPKPIRKDRFPNSVRDKGGGYSNFDKFGIPSFDGNLDIESTLLWIEKIDNLFDIKHILMEDYVELVVYKHKGRAVAW